MAMSQETLDATQEARRLLKRLLQARGITQTAIADRCGVSVSYVSRVLAGTRESAAVRLHIARRLGMAQRYVFGPQAVEPLRAQLRHTLTQRRVQEALSQVDADLDRTTRR